jgi:hypothetical protein
MSGLEPHFPGVGATDYFRENFSSCVEERHAEEALELAESVLRRRPELATETVADAKKMGGALDQLWSALLPLLESNS